MTDTQELLTKIVALRQRLEQAQGLALDAGSVAASLLKEGDAVAALRRKVNAGASYNALIDASLRPSSDSGETFKESQSLPPQLTARAARLLRRANDLLGELRAVVDNALLQPTNGDPLAQFYRETANMTEAVVRSVQTFPEGASAQLRLCEGLEAVLNVVADRIAIISRTLSRRRREKARCNTLAEILVALATGCRVENQALASLAESVQEDVLGALPLQWPRQGPESVPLHIAAHSLAAAQVMARLVRHDPEWRNRPLEPIQAALIHDVGMVRLPSELLAQKSALADEQRRQIEAHAIVGVDMAARIEPTNAILIDAAGQHHERLDGTGYPAGLRALQIKPLIRLLAVCDVYAAMCQPRAHRDALDTRTALTDTLLLAEQGALDRDQAEKLLLLSFFPVGSVVELSDGALGVVVATHQGRRDLNTPARPVVTVLTDQQGQLLPMAETVDLAEAEGRGILRSLPPGENRQRIDRRYVDLAG
jgi:HD-GYP domain-containing protein (c-di-GMP phosphodiesterase class II)